MITDKKPTKIKPAKVENLDSLLKLLVIHKVKEFKCEQYEIKFDDSVYQDKIDEGMLRKVMEDSKISTSDKDLLYASAF